NKIATATIGQWTATIRMADRNVDVSGTAVSLSGDTYVDQGVMYVPATFFHDAFGYNVQVDPGSQQVSIALPGECGPRPCPPPMLGEGEKQVPQSGFPSPSIGGGARGGGNINGHRGIVRRAHPECRPPRGAR